jgi:Ca2+-binding RTX toxin-like protein
MDTAVYSGPKSAYSITKTGAGYTVSGGGDGTDTLSGIERLQFSDGVTNLGGHRLVDTNGDGKSDLLWRNNADGMVVVWDMNGTHIGPNAVLDTPSNAWTIVDAHGDFDGDGKSDLLWRNSASGTVVVWLMDGTHIGPNAVLDTPSSAWTIIDAHGDYNGDGKSDILWRNNDGTVVVWLMDGTHIGPNAVLDAPSNAWKIADATGDYDGDGKSDLLWYNSANGTVVLWEMNGTQVGPNAVLDVHSTVWAVVDGAGSGASLTGDAGSNALRGTVGNDRIVGLGGNDVLTGNAGSDTFVFNTALDGANNVDTVTDFASGVGGDKLDIRDLLVGYNAQSSVVSNFVHLVESGGSTTVQVNADGAGTDFVPVATLSGVTGLLLNDLLANHNLIVT